MISSSGCQPQRKALLIGIEYANNGVYNRLHGPHKDVRALQKMLLEQYDYAEKDIVLMLDDDSVKHLEPTRKNILREVKNLVRGARAGDQFVFHFSGHGDQVDCKTGTEDDGKDEVLVPCDARPQGQCTASIGIIDNDLKKYLVDPLPVGSNLFAVLDSCHSASLLGMSLLHIPPLYALLPISPPDLDHQRCNRVWKAHDSRCTLNTLHKRDSSSALDRSKHDHLRRTMSSIYGDEFPDRSTKSSFKSLKALDMTKLDLQFWLLEAVVCNSPEDIYLLSHKITADRVPNVICLAACKDSQDCWEANGQSLTMGLIHILERKRNPSLKEMMTQISKYVHDLLATIKKSDEGIVLKHCQDPQLASLKPLDMDSIFTL